jgi:hypothetical protein
VIAMMTGITQTEASNRNCSIEVIMR